jgi:hypothetical protein
MGMEIRRWRDEDGQRKRESEGIGIRYQEELLGSQLCCYRED